MQFTGAYKVLTYKTCSHVDTSKVQLFVDRTLAVCGISGLGNGTIGKQFVNGR